MSSAPILVRLAVASALIVFAISAAKAADKPRREIVDTPAEVIETGFQLMSCCSIYPHNFPVGNWLDEDRLLFNPLQNVPDANARKLRHVVVFDTRSREAKVLYPNGFVICYEPDQRIARISRDGSNDNYEFVKFDNDANPVLLTEDPGFEKILCRPKDYQARWSGVPGYRDWGHYLSARDGFIPFALPGQKRENIDRSLATVIRPDAPPLTLPVLRSEIRDIRYLAFSGQYQLTTWDSQDNGFTDRRLAGSNAWGSRPYALTPYRLLSRDGSIEEIPYPYVIREYGIQRFGELLPTKAGILINAQGSLLLIDGNRLRRVWGKPSFFKTPEAPVGFALSPSGCKLAFFRYANWKPKTRKPITIVNLCRGA